MEQAQEQTLLETQTHDFQFTGNAAEYFKIWIVNIGLSILTLGIYSAWAKVRNTQYFYGNTRVSNAAFQYLATPIVILKGRLIAVMIFLIYAFSVNFYPGIEPVFMLLLIAVMPFVIVRSLRFRMRNTAYRNIRFNFTGRYGEAAFIFLLLPIIVPLTLGLMLPYWQYRTKQFIVDNTAYGTTNFKLECTSRPFFNAYFTVLGMWVLAAIFMFILFSLESGLATFVATVAMFLMYSFTFAYMMAVITNVIFNNSTLSQHSFNSDLKVGALYKIYLLNGLMIALSLGLMIPWALTRLANYRAECTQLNTVGDFDHFVAAEQQQVSALGEEFGEVFDFEVGL